jgi:hypothetical protein
MKNLSSRKFSFQKVMQFSQGNNVLDAPASSTDSPLSKDTCVSSTQVNRDIRNKESLSPLWKTYFAGSITLRN